MIFKEEEEKPKIIIDGFEIETVIEDEEPLFVSREDPVTMPDYSGDSALCGICKVQGKNSFFSDIVDAVKHVHKEHGVLGGSQILMLGMSVSSPERSCLFLILFLSDADRMLKSGYLSLTAQVPDADVESAPVETEEKVIKETVPVPDVENSPTDTKEQEIRDGGSESHSGTNQNIVGLLHSQVTPVTPVTPAAKGEIQSKYLSTTPSQVTV